MYLVNENVFIWKQQIFSQEHIKWLQHIDIVLCVQILNKPKLA